MIAHCTTCPRLCGVRREDHHPSAGFCGMPALPRIARAALHYGEEPVISGTRGSGAIFFSGCSLSCAFCQNHAISHDGYGKTVSVQRLADIFRELEQQGAQNINLVNPTHFAVAIREALFLYKPTVPVIYNTGGYERIETLQSLEGLVDIYLPDLKYRNSKIAGDLSGAPDYFDVTSTALTEMLRQTGPVTLDAAGILQRGTIVRHLVLPGHTRESMAILEFLQQYKEQLWISLMFQYTPITTIAEYPALSRKLTARECEKVYNYMLSLGITDGYVQDRNSSGIQMIPVFDLTGV